MAESTIEDIWAKHCPGTAKHRVIIRHVKPDIIVLGRVVGCTFCQAYLEGCVREPADGFCRCGQHLQTLKKEQKERARRELLYAQGQPVD